MQQYKNLLPTFHTWKSKFARCTTAVEQRVPRTSYPSYDNRHTHHSTAVTQQRLQRKRTHKT